MKTVRVLLNSSVVFVILCLVVLLVVYLAAPDPLAMAKAESVAQGEAEQDLDVLRYEASNHIFGGTAHVEFHVSGHDSPKTVHVELRRPAWSPQWQVVSYGQRPPGQE